MKLHEILDEIIEAEGRTFTDDPDDRGGPTKFGITQTTLGNWLGRSASIDEVRNLTEERAREIYEEIYILHPKFEQIPDEHLRVLVIDSGVNHGIRRASRWLQSIVGATPDGFVGPRTLERLSCHDPFYVWCKYLARRIKFYGAIVAADRSQAKFINGWNRRVASFLEDRVNDS